MATGEGEREPQNQQNPQVPPPAPPPAVPNPAAQPPPPPTQSLDQLYQQFGFGGPGALDNLTASLPPTGGTSNVLDNLLSAYSHDIPYFQSTDLLQTPEGQAVYESLSQPVHQQADLERQQLTDFLGARQGMSGPLLDELQRIGQQEEQGLSNIQRSFLSDYGTRLQTAEGALNQLNTLQNEQMLQGLGLEQLPYDIQRQGFYDLLAALNPGMQIPGQTASISQGLISDAASMGQQAQQQQAASNAGLSNLFSLYYLTQPRPQTTVG